VVVGVTVINSKPVGDIIMRVALSHHSDIIWTCDGIGQVTIRLPLGTFLEAPIENKLARYVLSFWDI